MSTRARKSNQRKEVTPVTPAELEQSGVYAKVEAPSAADKHLTEADHLLADAHDRLASLWVAACGAMLEIEGDATTVEMARPAVEHLRRELASTLISVQDALWAYNKARAAEVSK